MPHLKSISLLLFTVFFLKTSFAQQQKETKNESAVDKIILVSGSMSNDKEFIQYVAGLTKKANPKICFVPTASADNPYAIAYWYATCAELPVHPYVMRTFLNASPDQMTFEETIMSMDAIIVGGGGTLNMIGIW